MPAIPKMGSNEQQNNNMPKLTQDQKNASHDRANTLHQEEDKQTMQPPLPIMMQQQAFETRASGGLQQASEDKTKAIVFEPLIISLTKGLRKCYF